MRFANWQLRGEQFGALWDASGQDRPPFPLSPTSPARTHDAFEYEQRRIQEAFAGEDRDNVRLAVRILAEPEVFVEVSGETVEKTPIRVIGAQLQRWCAIAVQKPGPTPAAGGDVVLGAGITTDLAALLVGQIPQNAAGKRTFARNDINEDDYFSRSILASPSASGSAPRLEDAMRAGYAGRGTMRVCQGPRHTRGELGVIRWLDVAGDGRYMIGPRDPDAAVPADSQMMVQTLASLIARGLDAQRELVEQRW